MHGGLPIIGVSTIVYGLVAVAALARRAIGRVRGDAARRRNGGRPVAPTGGAR